MKRIITVLVVDDSAEVCSTLKLNLEHAQHFNVLTAQDGKSALRLAQKTVPDVILLDVMMPGMSGGQVAEALREHRSTAHIPIIFLTGMITKAELEAQGGEIGGEVFLAKPVSSEEIASTIHSVLGR
jgi:CheY-like chemotaxis protein